MDWKSRIPCAPRVNGEKEDLFSRGFPLCIIQERRGRERERDYNGRVNLYERFDFVARSSAYTRFLTRKETTFHESENDVKYTDFIKNPIYGRGERALSRLITPARRLGEYIFCACITYYKPHHQPN